MKTVFVLAAALVGAQAFAPAANTVPKTTSALSATSYEDLVDIETGYTIVSFFSAQEEEEERGLFARDS